MFGIQDPGIPLFSNYAHTVVVCYVHEALVIFCPEECFLQDFYSELNLGRGAAFFCLVQTRARHDYQSQSTDGESTTSAERRETSWGTEYIFVLDWTLHSNNGGEWRPSVQQKWIWWSAILSFITSSCSDSKPLSLSNIWVRTSHFPFKSMISFWGRRIVSHLNLCVLFRAEPPFGCLRYIYRPIYVTQPLDRRKSSKLTNSLFSVQDNTSWLIFGSNLPIKDQFLFRFVKFWVRV